MKINLCKILFTVSSLFIAAFGVAQNAGVGTTTPDSKLQVNALSSDSVALKVGVDGNTKLKVASNGGTSVGTAANPPANGLLVQGKIDPRDSIKSSTRPIYITSVSDSVVLQAGGTTIILSANGAVRIRAGNPSGISIDAPNGPVNISGLTVNIKALTNATLNGNIVTMQASALANIYSPLTRLGTSSSGTYANAARKGDQVFGTASGATVIANVTSGSPNVMIQ